MSRYPSAGSVAQVATRKISAFNWVFMVHSGERLRTPDAISVRRAPPGSALALVSVEAVRRMPFVMPHHQDEDALRGDFKEHVIGELLKV